MCVLGITAYPSPSVPTCAPRAVEFACVSCGHCMFSSLGVSAVLAQTSPWVHQSRCSLARSVFWAALLGDGRGGKQRDTPSPGIRPGS